MNDNFRPKVFKGRAIEALRGKWGNSAAVAFVVLLLSSGMSFLLPEKAAALGVVYSLFFGSFVGIGALFLWQDVSRGKSVEFDTLWEPFKDYGRYLAAVLRIFLYVFLWSLLLIVPGIIKTFSYSMTYFIMRDNPGMSGNQARKESMRMMQGHKWECFLLGLSFLGWILLSILTLGIGLLWVYPYIYTATAEFYKELKEGEV